MKPFFVVLVSVIALLALVEVKGNAVKNRRTTCEHLECDKGEICVEKVVIHRKRCHGLKGKERKLKHWCAYHSVSAECTTNKFLCGSKCNDNEICRVAVTLPMLFSKNTQQNNLTEVTCHHIRNMAKQK